MKKIKTIIVTVFLALLIIIAFVDIRGSFLEYQELGESYISVFTTNITYKYAIIGINFLVLFCIMYFTGRGIKKGLKVFFEQEKKEMPKLLNKSIALIVSWVVSIVIGIIITPKILLLLNQASFVQTDGVFNFDISFFMFTEPVIKMLILYGIGICIGLTIYSTIYYILVFNKYFDGIDRETLQKGKLIKNIIRYVRFIAINFSIFTVIRIPEIVFDNFSTTGSGLELVGAGFTDITIKIIGNAILAIVIIAAVFLATSNLKKGINSKVLKNLLIIPGYLVIMFIAILGFDIIFVNSNEYDKEKQYIEKNIAYTKNAYGIDYEDEAIVYSGTITEEEVLENKDIINNSVIIDKHLVLENLNEEQDEKGYYTYKTAGIYKHEDKLGYLSPKEISNARRTYNSKTFEYTHGYGAILTSTSSVTEDGELDYEQIDINVPQIYYGMETNNTVITNKDDDEYDYTDIKGNEYSSSYNGDSGLNISFLDRLILGIKKGNPSLAFSSKVSEETKILINRNIIQRAKLVISGPNIIYDENPYIIINENGELYWILDAYTISENYPYSKYSTVQSNGERRKINYIRNSIKVAINAYDGKMKFYLIDDTDPIAMTYKKMYSQVFENKDNKIPEDMAKHFIYPEFLYDVQASIIQEYHNIKPETLYRGDDSWSKVSYVTTQNNKNINNTLDSYYTSIKEDKIGLLQMYTPKGKQNINSYLIGTVENGINKLKIRRISSNETILGLTQLDNKISQDEGIAKEIEKLNVTGVKVTKKMMVIPIDNTLIYIEQIYQTKTNESNIPKLKKVIVASGNKVAIGNSLNDAIENLASQSATSIDTFTTEDLEGLIQSIIKANNNLTQSMNSKDLELIGSDVKKLQELINLLEKEQEKQREQEENTQITDVTENVSTGTIDTL